MFKALKDRIFHRQPYEDELVKLRQISERAKQFEQSVVDSMSESFNQLEGSADTNNADSNLDSDSLFK